MTSKVYVALRVKATPERAFQALVEEIGAWWRPNTMFQTTPRPGRLSFEAPDQAGEGGRLIETRAGDKVFEIGKILAWEPPRRLVSILACLIVWVSPRHSPETSPWVLRIVATRRRVDCAGPIWRL